MTIVTALRFLVLTFAVAVRGLAAPADDVRPPQWAVPLEKPGLPNFHRVTDSLYRGAQPTVEGFHQLKAMGVKTVVNLRSFHSDREAIGDLMLRREQIRFQTWHAEDEEVVRFLKLVNDPHNRPLFVHCQHGADRTGLMCAIYRMAVQGWSKAAAIQEMTDGGYGFHPVWTNLIEYLQALDIAAIQKQAGLNR